MSALRGIILLFVSCTNIQRSALGPNCGLSAGWLRPLTPDGINIQRLILIIIILTVTAKTTIIIEIM